jgi:hypothetical protein
VLRLLAVRRDQVLLRTVNLGHGVLLDLGSARQGWAAPV